MKNANRIMPIMIAALGVMAIIIGIVFVYQGFSKNSLIDARMKVEKVTIATDPNNPQQLTEIKNGDDAMKAADTIASHRRSIAPSYQELLDSGKYDPTNPKHLTYSQAMNLENYLYMAVTALGLVQVVLAAGAFMIISGIASVLTGLALYKNSSRAT